jgi:uncharacterized protein YkwD
MLHRNLPVTAVVVLGASMLLGACNLLTGADSLEVAEDLQGDGGAAASSGAGAAGNGGSGGGTGSTGSGSGSGSTGSGTSTSGTGQTAMCGDAACQPGETCTDCPEDCGACPANCGNLTCDADETCTNCSEDCGACPVVCGDLICDASESCATCAEDCGACAPVCGDAMCEPGETCTTCAADCGACETCEGAGPGTTGLDAEEQAFLGLINNYRSENGLGALSACTSLNRAAQGHSEDMRDLDYFSHTGQDGSSPWDRACAACYDLGCGPMTAMAENIAAGNAGAAGTFMQWQTSPGHNANMLGASFTQIGIGRATGGGQYGSYWTNVFGGATEPSCN